MKTEKKFNQGIDRIEDRSTAVMFIIKHSGSVSSHMDGFVVNVNLAVNLNIFGGHTIHNGGFGIIAEHLSDLHVNMHIRTPIPYCFHYSKMIPSKLIISQNFNPFIFFAIDPITAFQRIGL